MKFYVRFHTKSSILGCVLIGTPGIDYRNDNTNSHRIEIADFFHFLGHFLFGTLP